MQEGDLLASVDTVSVKTALKLLQEEIDDLDEEIEDEQGETVSSSIKSGVAGRVKKTMLLWGMRYLSLCPTVQKKRVQ